MPVALFKRETEDEKRARLALESAGKKQPPKKNFSFAEIFQMKPGGNTVPNTTSLSKEEREELDDEINMGARKKKK